MKNIFFSFFALIFTFNSFSQKTLEEKLNQVYSVEKTESILKSTQKKKYYNNVLFNSFAIINVPANKLKEGTFEVLQTLKIRTKNSSQFKEITFSEIIKLIETGEFNILLADIQRKMNAPIRFRLGNSNKILTIYSYEYLTQLQKEN